MSDNMSDYICSFTNISGCAHICNFLYERSHLCLCLQFFMSAHVSAEIITYVGAHKHVAP